MKILSLFLSTLFVLATFNIQAQKYGYINSSEIIMTHPNIKTADQSLMDYQKELISQGEEMAKKLEANYNAYVAEANTGTLSKVQMQERETALGTEQQKIQQFEVQVQQKILTRREQLYKPILDEIQAAVEEVAKAEGYMMVFDTSTGGILHANSTDDIMDKVKAKLKL